jgi:SpoVK/Ycf46/Vps4 family AAA+-type ATPase
LSEWVKKEAFPTFTFFSDNYVVIPSETGFMQITSSKNKIVVELVGDIEFCEKSEKFFAARFKKAENLIRWVYNQRGDDISVPLNYRPGLNAAYPWLGRPYSEYIADYLNSEASVLILIGPPGTGKTTFIKNIIHQSRGNARVAYDEKVLGGDDFFASFVDGDDDILVMEDADTFLSDRQDGNTMMHKFLNVSDGLISAIGKKMIFSTNLPNVNDIDPALMRAGRCFDVMEFRPLTREEAQEVLKEVGSDRALPDGRSFTLADIFSTQEHGEQARRNKTGFI